MNKQIIKLVKMKDGNSTEPKISIWEKPNEEMCSHTPTVKFGHGFFLERSNNYFFQFSSIFW